MGSSLTDERTRDAVVRARAGDEAALGELFTAHEQGVLRVCRRMLGSEEAARDARGEVFLRVQRALSTYDLERPFASWLYAIAGNHCVDLLRRRASERRIFADVEPSDADLHKLPADASAPSALTRLLAAEQQGVIGRAIEELPLKYRLPLVMRYFGDDDYATIAEALGVTTGQVGSLLFRAKRLLRERVQDPSAGRSGESR